MTDQKSHRSPVNDGAVPEGSAQRDSDELSQREWEAQYLAIIRSAVDGFWTADMEGRFLDVNETYLGMVGYTRDEFLRLRISDVEASESPEAVAAHIQKIVVKGGSDRFETRHRNKDGRVIDVEVAATYLPFAGGRFVAFTRDITERKRVEQALRDSEAKFRSLFDNMIEGLAHCQMLFEDDRPQDFIYLSVNPAFEKLTGLKNVVGRRVSEVLPGVRASDPMVFEMYGRVASTGIPERSEIYIEALGAWLDISVYSPKKEYFVAVFDVLTERKQVEAALGRARGDFRQLIDQLPESITVRRGGQFIYTNPAFGSLLGYTDADELVGVDALTLVAAEDRGRVVERFRRESEVAGPIEVHLVRKDGKVLQVAFSASQPIEFEGLPARISVARDMTERNKMQAQLLLADRMVSVGMLAAGVAHEINNPLAAASINIEAATAWVADLARRPGAPETLAELREMLSDAREGAERVRQIVRDLKVFSRAEEDTVARVEVHRVLDSTLRMAWNEVRHRARLVKDFGTVVSVEANEARLGQVFLNLVVNAAQAIPEGRVDTNEIRVTTRMDKSGRVVVEVKDTGPGIPPDIRARLFTPFFTTKPIGSGTGLGLSICQRIVSDLGGEIEVESEVGRGSIFRVFLRPAPPESTDAVPEPAATTATLRPTRRGRVLVIDDEVTIVRAVRRVLNKEHDVVVTTSAMEAMDRIRAGERFDVILCDLMMPEVTGMDFYVALQNLAPELAERVVFLTGGAFTPRARAFLDEVPNARMEKPFDVKNLLSLVRERVK